VFGPRREHAVWLVNPLCNKIIDHNPYVCFISPENKRFFSPDPESGINAGHQALGACLLVAGGSVYLACKIEIFHLLCLKGRVKLCGIDKIVFYGIPRSCYFHIFKAVDASEHTYLDIQGKARCKPVGIVFIGVSPLGFYENPVSAPLPEPNNLILDGWAVPYPCSLDLPCVEGRPLKTRAYDFVGGFVGIGNVAGHKPA